MLKSPIKSNNVKWRRSTFGLYADYPVPANCDVVVVAVMGGTGRYQLQPIELRLPHQIYYKDCVEWLKEHNAEEIVLIPANSKYYVG